MKNNLCTVSAHLPFADTLAHWMLERWGGEPLLLARAVIFLPSRRAAASLREAFLRASSGRPLLLPRIEPLGDADEDALLLSSLAPDLPPVAPSETFALRRLFLLARLVKKQKQQISGGRMDAALKLAAPLAELMDELEREEAGLEALERIVPDTFAGHWQVTVEFLRILSAHWPLIAQEEALISPGSYNAQVLKTLARHWQDTPPAMPVIAAGTTASSPATFALLATIEKLPQGFIVLPGLDMQAEEGYFEHMEESHPQWGMAQLLKKLGRTRKDVVSIGEPGNARVKLMSEVMRPATLSDAWSRFTPQEGALDAMRFIPCDNVQEEATVIALLLREALETQGKTAALVTHNRPLARRVAAIMGRFGVAVDDSAGIALKETPLAAFLRLILEAAAENFAALPLLSLLKHPLAQAGMERIDCLEAARELEVLALRGLHIPGGMQGIRQVLLKREHSAELNLLLDRVERAFEPLRARLEKEEETLSALLDAHLACAQALAGGEIWSGPEAEALGQLIREARGAAEVDGIGVEPESYIGVFEELLAGRAYRPRFGMHPRLKILSPMEARMQSFDRIILGGLNEGSWPPPVSDPWFSRPMRVALGLPLPERRQGLAAHDFFMLACGAEVFFTRSGKEGGMPSTPSRWLTKLEMLSGGLVGQQENWRAWAAALDAPDVIAPAHRPAPTPPLSARPREVSVTQVETWMRDPYAFYASRILCLRALEPLGRAPNASDFGNGVHEALERFAFACPEMLPSDALNILLKHGRDVFAELFEGTYLETLWWPRFARIAEWFISEEEKRRSALVRVKAEVKGACRIGDFTLTGRADRMEEGRGGSVTIVDYKTGTPPAMKDIEKGLSSQLVLLALIARESGAVGKNAPVYLEHWRLKGSGEGGKIEPVKPAKIEQLIVEAEEGLRNLIARYNDAAFPYRSVPVPSQASRYSDYDHLARIKEWG